jgi:hypothetical protein
LQVRRGQLSWLDNEAREETAPNAQAPASNAAIVLAIVAGWTSRAHALYSA